MQAAPDVEAGMFTYQYQNETANRIQTSTLPNKDEVMRNDVLFRRRQTFYNLRTKGLVFSRILETTMLNPIKLNLENPGVEAVFRYIPTYEII